MDYSFKEKSTWISFVSTLLIFGYYFIQLVQLDGLPPPEAKQAANVLLLKTIVLSIVVEALFHGMLAATNHKAAAMGADERDQLFELKANNMGYWVLGGCVVICIFHLLLSDNISGYEVSDSVTSTPYLSAHILIFGFILSELVRFGVRIFYYRRGI